MILYRVFTIPRVAKINVEWTKYNRCIGYLATWDTHCSELDGSTIPCNPSTSRVMCSKSASTNVMPKVSKVFRGTLLLSIRCAFHFGNSSIRTPKQSYDGWSIKKSPSAHTNEDNVRGKKQIICWYSGTNISPEEEPRSNRVGLKGQASTHRGRGRYSLSSNKDFLA